METIEYRNPTINKCEWGNGPWVNEPDKKQWLDEETGLACLIVRNTHCTGSWCGYVGVKEGHPFYGKEYNDIDEDIEVHGGLTFAGECQERENDFEGVCHKVDGEDKVWWLGFDCAHSGDLCPQMDAYRKQHMNSFYDFGDSYRDIDYVTAEVKNLAKQMKGNTINT